MSAAASADCAAVAAALKREALRHQPDPAWILERVHAGMARTASPRPLRGRSLLPGPGRRFAPWAVPLAAASVVMIIGLVLGLWRPDALSRPDVAGSPSSTPVPSTALSIETPARSAAVSLALTPLRDWLVAGLDPSNPEVVARANVVEQVLGGPGGTGEPATKILPGPFDVSWTDGQKGSVSGQHNLWVTAEATGGGPVSGLDVRAQPATDRRNMLVYAGASGADATITVLLDGEMVGERTLRVVDGVRVSAVITVDLTDFGDEQQVIVRLLAGQGGSVGVAAVALN